MDEAKLYRPLEEEPVVEEPSNGAHPNPDPYDDGGPVDAETARRLEQAAEDELKRLERAENR